MKLTRKILGIAVVSVGIGIIILTLLFTTSGKRIYSVYNNDEYDYEYNYTVTEEITSLDVDIAIGVIQVVEGDEFMVEVEGMSKDGFISEAKNGTWYVKNTDKDDYIVHFLGLEIPIMYTGLGIGYSEDAAPKVKITVKKGFEFDMIRCDIGAGSLQANQLEAKNCTVEMGTGSMRIDGLKVKDDAFFAVGAGQIQVFDFEGNNAKIDSGVGEITLQGNIVGNTVADAGIGQIYLNLTGNEEDYNYSIDCGIGSVKINERSYSGLARELDIDHQATKRFDLECGVGSIKLMIR